MNLTLDQFLTKYANKSNDYDGYYNAQCFDLFQFYNRDVVGANSVFYIQTAATTYQGASITSWDADGFTLSWTKTSTPTGTAGLIFMCFR